MFRVLIGQALRHSIATAVLAVALALGFALLYFVLLAIAIVFNLGLGGPLALPFAIVVGGLLGLIAGPLILLPLTLLVEWVCGKLPLFKTLAQIPLSSLLLLVALLSLLVFAAFETQIPLGEFLLVSGFGVVGALFALGVYWWTLRVVDVLTWPLRQIF